MVQAWLDGDGLYRKFGPDKAIPNKSGEYKTYGPLREVATKIDLTTLGTASAIVADQTFVPAGVRIEEVEIVVETAATGSGAVLNIGLIRTDRATSYDSNGFVEALALTALDAAGEKTVIRIGSTGAGTLIGTTLANVGLIVADYDTAAFTAGVITVRIRYMTITASE